MTCLNLETAAHKTGTLCCYNIPKYLKHHQADLQPFLDQLVTNSLPGSYNLGHSIHLNAKMQWSAATLPHRMLKSDQWCFVNVTFMCEETM